MADDVALKGTVLIRYPNSCPGGYRRPTLAECRALAALGKHMKITDLEPRDFGIDRACGRLWHCVHWGNDQYEYSSDGAGSGACLVGHHKGRGYVYRCVLGGQAPVE